MIDEKNEWKKSDHAWDFEIENLQDHSRIEQN